LTSFALGILEKVDDSGYAAIGAANNENAVGIRQGEITQRVGDICKSHFDWKKIALERRGRRREDDQIRLQPCT
jgi:hypothetical protein